jgi:hypothetical protein
MLNPYYSLSFLEFHHHCSSVMGSLYLDKFEHTWPQELLGLHDC